jgi:hypothetical protein
MEEHANMLVRKSDPETCILNLTGEKWERKNPVTCENVSPNGKNKYRSS